MMDPQRKSALMQFTTAAKTILYDAKRFARFLPMMDTKSGAIQAVQAVMSVIEQQKPIPPDIRPLLAVNTYMLMVDLAKSITKAEPDPGIVRGVVTEILTTMRQGPAQPAAAPPAPPAPQGIIQKATA